MTRWLLPLAVACSTQAHLAPLDVAPPPGTPDACVVFPEARTSHSQFTRIEYAGQTLHIGLWQAPAVPFTVHQQRALSQLNSGVYTSTPLGFGAMPTQADFLALDSADVDGDGVPEVVALSREGLVVWRVKDGKVMKDVRFPQPLPQWSTLQYFEADDMNGDGVVEVVILGPRHRYPSVNTDFHVYDINANPQVLLAMPHSTSVVVAQVDADPAREIVFNDGRIIDSNGWNLKERHRFRGVHSLAAWDDDGDGRDTLAFWDPLRLWVVDDGEVRWSTAFALNPSRLGQPVLRVAQLDDDPQQELVVAEVDSPDGAMSIWALDTLTGVPEHRWVRSLDPNWITVMDEDADGKDELHWWNSSTVYSLHFSLDTGQLIPAVVEPQTRVLDLGGVPVVARRAESFNLERGSFRLYDGLTGRILATAEEGTLGWTGAPADEWIVGDFDGDAFDELLFLWRDQQQGVLASYHPDSGLRADVVRLPPTNFAEVLAVDVDGDGDDDVAWRNGEEIEAYKLDGRGIGTRWWRRSVSATDLAHATDVDADGMADLVVHTSAGPPAVLRAVDGRTWIDLPGEPACLISVPGDAPAMVRLEDGAIHVDRYDGIGIATTTHQATVAALDPCAGFDGIVVTGVNSADSSRLNIVDGALTQPTAGEFTYRQSNKLTDTWAWLALERGMLAYDPSGGLATPCSTSP